MYERFFFPPDRYASFIKLYTKCSGYKLFIALTFKGCLWGLKMINPYKIPIMMPGTHVCTQPVSGCLSLAFCGSLLCSPHLFETPCPTDHIGARSKCSVLAIRCFWPLLILSTPSNRETLLFWFVALCYPNSPPASLTFPHFLSLVFWPLSLLSKEDSLWVSVLSSLKFP